MANPTLTDVDRGLLAELLRRPATPETLASGRDDSPETIRDRLQFMADNALVRRCGDGEEIEDASEDGETGGSVEGDAYELTDSGRRLLRAPSDGSADDAIDLPEDVLAAIEERDLNADRRDAVEGAYAFLRYWGRATGAEIADGVFGEAPLTHDDAGAWWTEFVRDHLAALPGIDPPSTTGGLWRFEGRPGFDDLSDDGRRMLFGRGDERDGPYASATEALVDADATDRQRVAVGAALAVLQDGGVAARESLRRAVDEAVDAIGESGGGTAEADDGSGEGAPDDSFGEWLDESLFDALGRLPGVVAEDDRYRYTLGPDGYDEP